MSIPENQKKNIKQVIIQCLRNKFQNYKPETENMPFHYRLLGKDRMALYSFIQSLNTTFGTSIFEPVALTLAASRFKNVQKQYIIGSSIQEECQKVIQEIMNDLTTGRRIPNKQDEIEKIRNAAKKNSKINHIKTVKVDLFLQSNDETIYLFDLKTAKPNVSNFKDFKRTLLEWIGILFTQNYSLNVQSIIAIPYNPYEPKPYERWTIKGMLDENELIVGKKFWEFLGVKMLIKICLIALKMQDCT